MRWRDFADMAVEAYDEAMDVADIFVDVPDGLPGRDDENVPLGLEALDQGMQELEDWLTDGDEVWQVDENGDPIFIDEDGNAIPRENPHNPYAEAHEAEAERRRRQGGYGDGENEAYGAPDGYFPYEGGDVTTRAELREMSEKTTTIADAVMVTRNTFGAAIDACAKYHGTSAGDMKLGAARFKDLFREEVAINWNDAPPEGVRSMFATGQDVTYESVEGDTLEFLRGLLNQIEESELPVVLAALYHAWTPPSRTTTTRKRKTTRRRRK